MHPAKLLNLAVYASVFVPFSSLFFPVVQVAKLHFNASFNRNLSVILTQYFGHDHTQMFFRGWNISKCKHVAPLLLQCWYYVNFGSEWLWCCGSFKLLQNSNPSLPQSWQGDSRPLRGAFRLIASVHLEITKEVSRYSDLSGCFELSNELVPTNWS